MPDGNAKPARAEAETKFGQGFLRDIWYFAALASDLKLGKLQRYEILGEPVLLARDRKGKPFAMRDICPHRAAPFSAGRLTAEDDGRPSVECPYHGWRFGTDGVCSAIPSLVDGQEMDVSRVRVRRYPTVESQGMVWIWVSSDPRFDGEPPEPPPVFEGAVGGAPKFVDHMDFDAHMDHAVVGLMDPTHAPYVHGQWWSRKKKGQHDKAKAFAPSERGFVMTRHAPSKSNRLYTLLGGEPLTEITFRLPGQRWEHVAVGQRQVLALTCLTPVNDKRTRITQIVWTDHWAASVLRPWFKHMIRVFLRQDGDMVNLQNEGLKYDTSLLWIDDADKQAKWYQQLKREWAASRREERAFRNPVEDVTLRWKS